MFVLNIIPMMMMDHNIACIKENFEYMCLHVSMLVSPMFRCHSLFSKILVLDVK